MSCYCHKEFHLILKLPFKLRFKINSVVFPKQPCSQQNDYGVSVCTYHPTTMTCTQFFGLSEAPTGTVEDLGQTLCQAAREAYKKLNVIQQIDKTISTITHILKRQDHTRVPSVKALVLTEKLHIPACLGEHNFVKAAKGQGRELGASAQKPALSDGHSRNQGSLLLPSPPDKLLYFLQGLQTCLMKQHQKPNLPRSHPVSS